MVKERNLFWCLFLSHMTFMRLSCAQMKVDCQIEKQFNYAHKRYSYVGCEINWNAAKMGCANRGGKLAEIHDDATQKVLISQMSDSHWNSLWIGANAIFSDWKWLTDNSIVKPEFYHGCFSTEGAQNVKFKETDTSMTPESCLSRCLGFSYGFISSHIERKIFSKRRVYNCYCGDNVPLKEAICDQNCEADGTKQCGSKSGFLIASTYSRSWGTNQPNNVKTDPSTKAYRGQQNCASLYYFSNTMYLNDLWCDDLLPSLCQYRINMHQPYDSQIITTSNKHVFVLNEKQNTWYGARQECLRNGGDLAAMTTAMVQIEVTKSLVNKKMDFWVGASNIRWKWISGSVTQYSSWLNGHPRGQPINNVYSCVTLTNDTSTSHNGGWKDEKCELPHGYICETVAATTSGSSLITKTGTGSTYSQSQSIATISRNYLSMKVTANVTTAQNLHSKKLLGTTSSLHLTSVASNISNIMRGLQERHDLESDDTDTGLYAAIGSAIATSLLIACVVLMILLYRRRKQKGIQTPPNTTNQTECQVDTNVDDFKYADDNEYDFPKSPPPPVKFKFHSDATETASENTEDYYSIPRSGEIKKNEHSRRFCSEFNRGTNDNESNISEENVYQTMDYTGCINEYDIDQHHIDLRTSALNIERDTDRMSDIVSENNVYSITQRDGDSRGDINKISLMFYHQETDLIKNDIYESSCVGMAGEINVVFENDL